MNERPTLRDIQAAAHRVHQALPPTPQIRWPLLCERTGAEVWVKHENHQPVGAFKVRGGIVYVDDLAARQDRDVRGVISATRGNHGQSIAFAARRHDMDAFVVAPHGNSVEKNAAMCAHGAKLIEYGNDFNDALEHAAEIASERNLHMVPSFHPLLVIGVATCWYEFFSAIDELHTVYVPIGLGSSICAATAARDALGCTTDVVGVVSAHAPAYALSFARGEPVSHPASTSLADGIAVRSPDPVALEMILRSVERIIEVTDDEVAAAMRIYFTDTHNVAEGAGAAPLAAMLQEQAAMRGRRVGLILSGGNVDRDLFSRVLAQ